MRANRLFLVALAINVGGYGLCLASPTKYPNKAPHALSHAESVQFAQSDENEGEENDDAEENQVTPNVAPEFLAKLAAISDSTATTPDQKLAAIDALVQSYGWPSTPPAIYQVVTAAREKISAQKAQSQQSSGIFADNTKKENDELGLFMAFSAQFYVAKYCADNGVYFTSDEVDRLQLELQKTFATMSLSQQKKDVAWQNIQAVMPGQLVGMTEEECATEKNSYAFMWPQVFAPSAPMANPF
ncbi:hypothetical protein [Mesorhizobium sp. L2C067A000]|uniref:hypothetical protein n=1 Tax=Mesorhizobium sp. L2C067A000 TaxID=1287106 RepID=UPI0003D01820|nr:hypothetical protein [Mesorhizobium sp. L2C067A000]ESZ27571.1 hypothetical protein X733_28490 [Mesorhizobium sp. L2C067A000]